MRDNIPLPEKRSAGRLILPSLVITSFARETPAIITLLLLIDIGLTFDVPVGVMGQIRTVSSIVAVISALLMGALVVRFKHKSLLITSLVFLTISALGCSLASNFNMMLITYALAGLGRAIIDPMAHTLTAEYFPLESRVKVIGWISAGMALPYMIGAPLIGFIASLGGWRSTFLTFVLPISFLSLLMVAKGLPSTCPTMSKGNYLEGFKWIFSNKSATACVVGSALTVAGFQGIAVYGVSFLRQRYLVSTGFASIIITGYTLCFTLFNLVTGRFVNRFGRKPVTVVATFLISIFVVSYTNLPNLWSTLAILFLTFSFIALGHTASTSLTLEQAPKFRGTMMSIHGAAGHMGSALGVGMSGLMLLLYDYEFMGISLGAMCITAAIIYYSLVIDPTRT